ncbi:hypothetical protein F4824DRAFT_510096 [Ustulina deusta]|nr:hypothetical protein F4824DRAFT_510096 [Ustulina deusta]
MPPTIQASDFPRSQRKAEEKLNSARIHDAGQDPKGYFISGIGPSSFRDDGDPNYHGNASFRPEDDPRQERRRPYISRFNMSCTLLPSLCPKAERNARDHEGRPRPRKSSRDQRSQPRHRASPHPPRSPRDTAPWGGRQHPVPRTTRPRLEDRTGQDGTHGAASSPTALPAPRFRPSVTQCPQLPRYVTWGARWVDLAVDDRAACPCVFQDETRTFSVFG